MLTSLEVYSPNSSAPDLPLSLGGGEDTDPIHIRDITGLGPVKATISTRPLGSADGEFYTGGILPKRNIVITFGLNPDWITNTPASLREMLYGYFMTKSFVKLRFFRDDLPPVEIVGYVEGCEPVLFAKDQEVQASIVCPMPDFVAVNSTILAGVATDTAIDEEFTYRGNIPAGALFELKNSTSPDGPAYEGLITLESKTLAPGSKTFKVTASIDAVSSLQVSSNRGSKFAKNIFGSESASVLNSLVAGSIWPTVEPGVNKFRAVIASAVGKPWTLTYFERFGGM